MTAGLERCIQRPTAILAALIFRKLPMKREVDAAGAWNIPLGYRPYHHDYRHLPDRNLDPGYSPGETAPPEGAPRRPLVPTKPALVAAMRRKKRAGAAEFPRKGLAVAYNPVLVRALRRSSRKKRPACGPATPPHARPPLWVRPREDSVIGAEGRRGTGTGNAPPPRRGGPTTTKGRV